MKSHNGSNTLCLVYRCVYTYIYNKIAFIWCDKMTLYLCGLLPKNILPHSTIMRGILKNLARTRETVKVVKNKESEKMSWPRRTKEAWLLSVVWCAGCGPEQKKDIRENWGDPNKVWTLVNKTLVHYLWQMCCTNIRIGETGCKEFRTLCTSFAIIAYI